MRDFSTDAIAAAGLALLLSGCAYTTATRVTDANRDRIHGIPIFAPKALLVVSGTGASSVIVPDCSREYAVQFGTIFAKNDVDLDIANGILTKLGSKQDSTALPLELLKSITEAAKAVKHLDDGLSDKASGGSDTFSVVEVHCDSSGKLSFSEVPGLKGRAVAPQPSSTPPEIPADNPPKIPGGGGPPPKAK